MVFTDWYFDPCYSLRYKGSTRVMAVAIGIFGMSKILASLGGNTGAVVAGGGMVVALAVGAYIGFGSQSGTAPADAIPEPLTATALTQQSTSEPLTKAEPEPQPEAAVAIAPQAPRFDELRRETDGTTIIAGRAEPLSEVAIIVDGTEVAKTTADSSGGFAAITTLPPKDTAQIVSLSSQNLDEGEQATVSLDEIILAPSVVPSVSPQPQEVEPAPLAVTTEADDATETDEATEIAEAPTKAVAEPEAPPTVAKEPARIAVLKSDEDGVRLLNAPKPEAMTSVALDTIGYSEAGDVQLSGRAQPDTARVRVYLDNRSVITLPVDAQGRWRGDLPDVDEGVYTLRVDEVSSGGDVSSRVETPFKRESAETLAQAASNEGPIKSITVQAGATLWAIARDRYGDGTLYLRVVEANAASIRDPDLIYPGQVFDLPN